MEPSNGPRQSDRQKNRARILAAARKLVLDGGHEKLSLRAVARKTGYSPAGLYEYFESKAALVRALAETASAGLGKALRDGSGGRGSAKERLVRVGLAYVRFARERSEDFLLLMSRMPSKRRSLDESVPAQSPFAVVLELCAEAVGAKQLRPPRKGNVETIAYSLWASVHGMAMLQLTHLRDFQTDFEAADRAVLEALLDGWRA